MYLVNTELTINWTLYSKVSPPSSEDITVVEQSTTGVMADPVPIDPSRYIPPSINNMGHITHKFTPNIVGLWKLHLYISGILVDTQKVNVSRNDTTIKKFVSINLP